MDKKLVEAQEEMVKTIHANDDTGKAMREAASNVGYQLGRLQRDSEWRKELEKMVIIIPKNKPDLRGKVWPDSPNKKRLRDRARIYNSSLIKISARMSESNLSEKL